MSSLFFCQIGVFKTSKNLILSRHHHFILFLALVAIPARCLDTRVNTAPRDEGIPESKGVFQFKQPCLSQKKKKKRPRRLCFNTRRVSQGIGKDYEAHQGEMNEPGHAWQTPSGVSTKTRLVKAERPILSMQRNEQEKSNFPDNLDVKSLLLYNHLRR
jgi:hypothetical protein